MLVKAILIVGKYLKRAAFWGKTDGFWVSFLASLGDLYLSHPRFQGAISFLPSEIDRDDILARCES